jgi:transposase
MIAKLVAALRSHEDLARRLALVGSIDGVGPRTALAFIIRMPELGRLSREQAAALAGLAPFVHDSGDRKGETSYRRRQGTIAQKRLLRRSVRPRSAGTLS